MLKKTTILTSILLALLFGAVVLTVTNTPPNKQHAQDVLTKEVEFPKNEGKYPTKQMRSGVSKDLWINDGGPDRLHHHLECPRSILTAYTSGTHTHLIEQMLGMKCYLQERVGNPIGEHLQQIRYIESQEGTYRYSDQYFDAQSVFIALFRLPGKSLPLNLNLEEAFLKGVAQEVSLSFSQATPNFQAQKFKAHICPSRSPL